MIQTETKLKMLVDAMRSIEYRIDLSTGDALTATRGEILKVKGKVTNLGEELPGVINGTSVLSVGGELRNADNQLTCADRFSVRCDTLKLQQSIAFELTLDTARLSVGEGAVLIVDLVYDGLTWMKSKGRGHRIVPLTVTSPVAYDVIDETTPVEKARFWKQHVPEFCPGTKIGISSPRFQEYIVPTEDGLVSAKSMLTEYELALLYALARHHFKGIGKIVDLGPLIGVGTHALARGLKANPVSKSEPTIYSYDLFRLEHMEHFLPPSDGGGTGSVFRRFLETNRDYLHYICPVPGDIMKTSWTGEPIEILFIDLAKTWELNRHVVQNFFSSLIPGHSILLQQDYAHVGEPFIALTMEVLGEYFEKLYYVFGATAAFKLVKPIPAAVLATDMHALPQATIDSHFENAIRGATPAVAEILKCCQGLMRLDKGDIEGAIAILDQVDLNARDGLDVSQEFASQLRPSAIHLRMRIESLSNSRSAQRASSA